MSDYSSDALATPPVSAVERGRRAYRRKQTVRSVLVSLASTIVVAGILVAVVVNSDGWEATRNTFFNGKYFVEAFPQVLSGLWLNIRILLIAVLGVAVALGIESTGLVALIAVFATATAIASFTMAQQMGGDAELAGDIVVATSVLCPFTIFGFAYALMSLGLIAG